jgi:hypothetical protein
MTTMCVAIVTVRWERELEQIKLTFIFFWCKLWRTGALMVLSKDIREIWPSFLRVQSRY